MAAVIAGGLVTSTVLILLVLPAAYIHLHDVRRPGARAAAVMAVILGALTASGCGGATEHRSASAPVRIEGSGDGTRLVLTARAAQRIGVRTAPVRRAGASRWRIPYAAVLYEPSGSAVTYTSPSPLHYARRPIVVDRIAGGAAVLRKGPPAGTRVVTVGAAELLGAEQGVAGEG
jgi:hypothetical protein